MATAPRRDRPRPGRELQLLAAAKHGLGPRDIPPSISFFQGVRVDGEGALRFEGSAGPGTAVELKVEMPAIAILANVPHPLDPRPEYTASTLEVLAWRGDPTGPDDALWSSTPELERAYLNTADYCDARGIRERVEPARHRRDRVARSARRRRLRHPRRPDPRHDPGGRGRPRRARRRPRPVVRRRRRRRRALDRRPRRQPGRRLHPLLGRRHLASATAPPTRSPRRGGSSSPPARCCAPTGATR